MELENLRIPINIFLDTNAYISNKYNFEFGGFKALEVLVKFGKAQLFINEIVEREILSNIDEATSNVGTQYKSALKSLNKELPSIKHNPSFYEKFKVENVSSQIKEFICASFEAYTHKNEYSYLSLNVNIESIIDDYFNKKYPFGTGKKKNEFPDAITIHSINNHCIIKNEKMIVISDDKDFINSFEGSEIVRVYEDIKSFLMAFNEYYNETIYNIITNYDFDLKQEKPIKEKITDYLYNDAYQNFPTEWDDPEIDVMTIGKVEVFSIDEVIEDYVELTLNVPVIFKVDYSKFNEDNSYYDKEEDEYLVYNEDHFRDVYSTSVQVQIELNVEFNDSEILIEGINVDSNSFDSDQFELSIRYELTDDGYQEIDLHKYSMIDF